MAPEKIIIFKKLKMEKSLKVDFFKKINLIKINQLSTTFLNLGTFLLLLFIFLFFYYLLLIYYLFIYLFLN